MDNWLGLILISEDTPAKKQTTTRKIKKDAFHVTWGVVKRKKG